MNLFKSVNMKKDLMTRVGVITIIIGLLLVTLEVNGQRRRSRQRSSINIPSINTSNTTLRNTLCTSPFSKQRVVGQCKPLVKCNRFFHQIPQLSKSSCKLLSGEVGVCCPYVILGPVRPQKQKKQVNFRRSLLTPPRPPKVTIPPIKTRDINVAFKAASRQSKIKLELERKLAKKGFVLRRKSPSGRHRTLLTSSTRARKLGRTASKVIDTSRNLVQSFGLSKDQGTFALPTFGTSGTNVEINRRGDFSGINFPDKVENRTTSFNTFPAVNNGNNNVFGNENDIDSVFNELSNCDAKAKENLRRKCFESSRGSKAKYRTIDGSCNNLEHLQWGQANTAFQRLLPSDYEDGVSTPRGAFAVVEPGTMHSQLQQTLLPSARSVSNAIIVDSDKPSRDFTLLLMQWGQFVDHDITFTPLTKGEGKDETNERQDNSGIANVGAEVGEKGEGSDITCCEEDGRRPVSKDIRHPECFEVKIPRNDPFYSRLGQTCMEFVRSMPAERPECNLGPREQVNQITSFLDGSNVYGSDDAQSRRLRLGRRGRLRVTRIQSSNGRQLLPLAPSDCADHAKRHYCFAAGDERCNEQPELTVLHTVFMREHNRIAAHLSLMNLHWDDERLYQEARRIVGAQIQHITYNEWLPLVLGSQYMDDSQLKPIETGYQKQYDPTVNPSIANVFATAAFRFGHSLVQGQMDFFSLFGNKLKSLRLHHHQFAPFEIYDDDALDNFIRGLVTQPSQEMDSSFSKELTQHLFQGNTSNSGMDLVALNVQRGRDHGLPPYVKWRQLCGLRSVKSWKMFASVVSSPELVPRLQQLYGSIENLDLYIGGLLERKDSDAMLGPTFKCLVGDQFRRIRLGDRFWYEEPNQAGSFTIAQLDAIRETSLARILCDNGDSVQLMQPLAFKKANDMNKKVGCNGKAIPRVPLDAWKETV